MEGILTPSALTCPSPGARLVRAVGGGGGQGVHPCWLASATYFWAYLQGSVVHAHLAKWSHHCLSHKSSGLPPLSTLPSLAVSSPCCSPSPLSPTQPGRQRGPRGEPRPGRAPSLQNRWPQDHSQKQGPKFSKDYSRGPPMALLAPEGWLESSTVPLAGDGLGLGAEGKTLRG